MKLALISAVLFLLSYVAVNRGLGPQPWLLVIPLSVAIGSALGARWLMARRRGGGNRGGEWARFEADFPADFQNVPPPQRHVPQDRASPPPRPSTGSPGGKARKLF